jgi:protease I
MTEAQRALIEAGALTKIISPDAGLVNGWAGDHWGHHYAVDAALATALSGDYDMLVVPGGQRSLDKLKLTAHTKRFINGFLVSDKPVVMYGDALHLLITTDNVRGRTVAGPADMKDVVAQAGGNWSDTTPVRDGVLVTGASDDATRKAMITEMVDIFAEHATMRRNTAAAVAA